MPCSIATCKSNGHAPTDNKIDCVLFDSGLSKTLIHKCIVPGNFTPIPSINDLQIFSLVGTTTSTALVALNRIRFPEFNCNIIVDTHPALTVDSTSLHYDIIFDADFLDKCRVTLDYDNSIIRWMEYTIPLSNALEFFPTTITHHN